MKQFFLFETELPAGSGFALFGPCHLAWLFCILICIFFTTKWYQALTPVKKESVNKVTSCILLSMGIYRDAVLLITRHYNLGFMPLHLCNMAIVIAFLYAWTGVQFFGIIYVLLCVPGAMGALIFPNWDAYPIWNYMHIHAFFSHGLTVAFGVWLLWSGIIRPVWKDFWMPVLFGGIGFIVLHYINGWLGTNFWFLNKPSHGSPLVKILKITGNDWYLMGYFIFCVMVVGTWQLLLITLQKRKKK